MAIEPKKISQLDENSRNAIKATVNPTPPLSIPFDIKVSESSTIPIIEAGTRIIHSVTLGVLNNKTSALIGFFIGDANVNQIKACNMSPNNVGSQPLIQSIYSYAQGVIEVGKFPPNIQPIFTNAVCNMMRVTENYADAYRFVYPVLNEKYDAGLSFPLATRPGATYSDLGVGVLVGYYSIGTTGCLELSRRVLMESAWLTQDGENTVLNLALRNSDTGPTATRGIRVATYE